MEAALLAWFDDHGRDLPWRKTRDPYAILVSEVMLQQSQARCSVSFVEPGQRPERQRRSA
jgi:A/G-specific adenine glycosylase